MDRIYQAEESLTDSPSEYSDDSINELDDEVVNVSRNETCDPNPTKQMDKNQVTEAQGASNCLQEKLQVSDQGTKPKANLKRKRNPQKFLDEWLKEPDFKLWLQKRKKQNNSTAEADVFQPYCIACSEYLSCMKNDIRKHSLGKRHKENEASISKTEQQRRSLREFATRPENRNSAVIEARICAFIAENNLAISLADKLVPLMKISAPMDQNFSQISLGKQKAGNIIREGYGTFLTNELSEILKRSFFSIIIDETTDVSVQKKLGVVAQFYDFRTNRLNVELLDLIDCPDGTASSLSQTVIKLLSDMKLDLKMLVGFSADTCNTMFGAHNSVSVHLKRAIPHMVSIKCSCHSIHLTASKACSKLPKQIQQLISNVYSHFSRSPKRRESFKEFQQFTQCEYHSILSPAETRWLSLEKSVRRLLEQYSALELYFTDLVSETPKPDWQLEEIVLLLRDPLTKPYLEFLAYVLGCFNEFNTMFQAEQPLVHELKKNFEKLFLDFAKNFMRLDYVRNKVSSAIDLTRSDMFLPLHDVYLGPSAYETILNMQKYENEVFSQSITYPSPLFNSGNRDALATLLHEFEIFDSQTEGSADYGTQSNEKIPQKQRIQSLLFNCKEFYVQALNDLRTRFKFDDQIFEITEMLEPQNARNLNPRGLGKLFSRFPNLKDICDPVLADKEWNDHAMLPTSAFGVETETEVMQMSVEKYWSILMSLTTVLGAPKFPNLAICVALLFCLPVSNAPSERVFSALKNIKTDKRNRLCDLTISSLMKIKNWLKRNEAVAHNVVIPDKLIEAILLVKANAAISD